MKNTDSKSYIDDLYNSSMWVTDQQLVVASAREHGMDIIAVTDHNAFLGSVVAREKATDIGLDMPETKNILVSNPILSCKWDTFMLWRT